MKITIIGAGNIGSAVAACLAKGHLYNETDIIVSTPHTDKLENLHKQFPAIRIMTENQYAISEADIIILAVKPCIVDEVLSPLRFSRTQILVSLVTGISISHLAHLSETFKEGGKCLFAEEKQLDIISALTSSGIAFALKYIHAAMQAGIELGISAEDAMRMTAYSMEGATELILNHNTHPLLEIEKAATPGGATIKGLNELEHRGFTSAVIHAIKSSATVSTDKETEE